MYIIVIVLSVYKLICLLVSLPVIWMLLRFIFNWIIWLINFTLSVLTSNFKLLSKLFLSVCHIEFRVDIIFQVYIYIYIYINNTITIPGAHICFIKIYALHYLWCYKWILTNCILNSAINTFFRIFKLGGSKMKLMLIKFFL